MGWGGGEREEGAEEDGDVWVGRGEGNGWGGGSVMRRRDRYPSRKLPPLAARGARRGWRGVWGSVRRERAGAGAARTDAQRPNVRHGRVVPPRRVAHEHLGRRIHERAALGVTEEGGIFTHLLHHSREPEVGDLDLVVVVEQDVLGLQVAVVHVQLVAVADGLRHLDQVATRCLLIELPTFGNAIEELATAAQLLLASTGVRAARIRSAATIATSQLAIGALAGSACTP